MPRLALFVLAVLASIVGMPAAAQSLGSPPGYREYLALLGTPTASLPLLPTYTVTGVAQRSPELVARYGYVADITNPLAPATGGHASRSLDSFGLTGILAAGLGATVSLTAGVSNERCTGCAGSRFMASVGGDYRVLTTSISTSSAMRLTIGTNAEVGFGHPEFGTTWTADVGIPLALAIGEMSGTQIIPFVTPSVAFVSANSSSGSADLRSGRGLVGAGVSLFNAKSVLGASVGFQYVFVSRTQLQLGVGLSLGGR
jgi:hypothetical protein